MKIASRYLLPLELYMSATMIAWAISGWIGQGSLWSALQASQQNLEWGSVMLGIGAAHFIIAAFEWTTGKRWCDKRIFLMVSHRAFCSAMSCVVWFYACFKTITLPGMEIVVSLWVQAPMGAVFSAWCFIGNMRVRHILDPNTQTINLERTIIMERRSLTGHR